MDTPRRAWWEHVFPIVKALFWVFVILLVFQQLNAPARLARARADLLDRFQQQRKSRVIAMIHRQETVSILGLPVSTAIDIEDSEAVLRAIRLTPDDQPIDLILHARDRPERGPMDA